MSFDAATGMDVSNGWTHPGMWQIKFAVGSSGIRHLDLVCLFQGFCLIWHHCFERWLCGHSPEQKGVAG
jgi:hypothetical protein